MPRAYTPKNTVLILRLLDMLTQEKLTMKVAAARLGVSTQEGHRWLFALGLEPSGSFKETPGPGRNALVYELRPEEADAAKERLLAFNAKWVGKQT